ncbi:MAG: LLM class flavin-dependent oxidoreductase [Gammaproteobacteria bacterium]|nr:LLM class flavin-dependent oxidoreductase [Gammaproteobacteria bacterium]
MRFDLRHPAHGADKATLYAAMLDICEWGDALGFDEVFIGEHHGAEDGYIPSPIVAAAAIAARTRRIKIHLSALIITFYEPVKLAEDLAVLDILSNGRLRLTVGMGYRPHEFAMFRVPREQRLQIYLDRIRILEQAWTGESFDVDGQKVRVLPTPIQRPGPQINMGGSTEQAMLRAARMGYPVMPGYPPHYEIYKAELARLGRPPPPPLPNQGPNFLYVTDDPERDWPIVGPFAVYTMNSYARWGAERGGGATYYSQQETLESARSNPLFQFVTPEQCVQYAQSLEPHGELTFQPLFGGLPPDLAWRSLRLFEREALPLLQRVGLR